MGHVISKDGIRIAFDKQGKGPSIIIVNGAMGYREFYGDKPLAAALSDSFTVYIYDRRGRGESSDDTTYTVEKEIDDIEALIQGAGGSAFLYGVSSGAALALLAAAKLGSEKIPALALYEPPYGSDDEHEKKEFTKQKKTLGDLISLGIKGDAAAFFISSMGTPEEALEELKKSEEWAIMQRVEHTLAYEYEVLGDGTIPRAATKKVIVPVLVMNGELSFDFMRDAAERLTAMLPNAHMKTLKDQNHQASPDVMAPALKQFFKNVNVAA